jgi:hypothetical protein
MMDNHLGHKYQSLIDTGASISIVRQDIVNMISKHKQLQYSTCKVSLS